ncbi:Putative neutral zinc metallopeptidase [Roseovarius albus]|uniref:Putative neutral zinc metallopeptidase n=1 Tax=Roseovarius albus TaxID=1247867 RepID=A0A1X6YKP3_9RHOB|nr:neutral zinc metallopeptidase [Roseovarius albus]SLN24184.1 Putative neutral zinc metallopeptidase [Roseovarius albus]
MKLRGIGRSRNIEDRRGRRGVGRAKIGGIGLLLLLAVGYFTGLDVTPLLEEQGGQSNASRPISAEEERAAEFSAQVLTTTEAVWTQIFDQQLGRQYRPPVMVLYSGVTQSPCGGASGATGPFYCPADSKAYLDTEFFTTLSQQLGARGDFAAAYVIAHEVAHHVQNELGILPEVHRAQQSATQVQANALAVRLELQADCLSGVWARAVGNLLEPGDLEEAVNAAQMIGDDHLQRRAGQVPQPHTFQHGTSEQRARWFATGYQSGMVQGCDTFNTNQL